jgi:hypothetical protein
MPPRQQQQWQRRPQGERAEQRQWQRRRQRRQRRRRAVERTASQRAEVSQLTPMPTPVTAVQRHVTEIRSWTSRR